MLFALGMIIGAVLGCLATALACAASREDDRTEEILKKEDKE
jgi:hypothetical protein